MEKREQDILKKIEEKTRDAKVPESLEPARIEKLLAEKDRGHAPHRAKIYRIGGLLAACLALCAGIWTVRNLSGNVDDTKNSVTESTAESAAVSTTEDAAQAGADTGAGADGGEDEAVSGSPKKADTGKTDDYKKVYSYIKAKLDEQERQGSGYYGGTEEAKDIAFSSGATRESSAEDMAMSAADAGGAKLAGTAYSETNVRQKGVDEGDIVKTDGRYLYVLKQSGRQISVVDTKDSLKEVGEIKAKKNQRIEEFYVLPEEKRLVYISTVYEEGQDGEDEITDGEKDVYADDILYLGNGGMSEKAGAVTLDISDPKKPKELGRITQSGYYSSSRMAGGYLYLFSSYSVGNNIDSHKPRTFIPMVNDSLIREKDISLPPFKCGSMYEVVTAVNLDKPSETADSKAIFTDGGSLYVSNENIYYYETKWNNYGDAEKTVIRKIGYKDGKLSKAVQGSIKGYINDSFSIDEYKGNLRIVATVGETNSVYVLNGKLKTIGSIKKLAKDERVYSARLLGDTGYFVTFRETDPLFSVDFSDPENPKILGKLKIPGFSDYLHFYGKDKLLGIGMNVEEEAGVTDGVKLSMFDISDNKNVKEEHKLVLKNVYGTDVSYDYKAALIDVGKNIIGFAGSTEGGERYYLFSYDAKSGFTCKMSEEINGRSGRAARGVYISDTLYVVCGNVIEAYSLKDYKKVEDLIL